MFIHYSSAVLFYKSLDKDGTSSLYKIFSDWFHFLNVHRLLLFKEEMFPKGKHDPVSAVFRCFAAIKFKMSLFFKKMHLLTVFIHV